MLFIRSAAFTSTQILSTVVYGAICLLFAWFLPFPARHRFVTFWVRFNLWCLARICSIEYQVEGKENIPETVGVVLSRHESAWETLALQVLFTPQTWVLKRELLWIPFLGWGLIVLHPISLDRNAGVRALGKLVREGCERVKAGGWVIIFPEGTRAAPGETKPYLSGGAMLAKRAGCCILPVAHNAGDFWARRGFVKKPGTIRVVIGPVIDSKDRGVAEMNALAKTWIEDTMQRIRNQ
uniref:1-acyl-sn-glycerol-3-phosphate acyltransferase n=1 Tax=Candidatus Kentrum sp. TC TaxID=2126339 RepID=A0A450YU81_9GAMM|nr:MAG: 1-acyl-sn-glycerol-3-phosphate acyltransferase [Candidatus Kentron sp. TC]VFK45117.1 MAG: 1-acyl-sn-glycerol-3-phosphate acyltransferase [Candidatus Kentron sp. TC]